MSEIDSVPYPRVAFKASHNSIDRGPTISEQLSGTGGLVEPCRGIELDLVQDQDRFVWRVQHGVNNDGPRFRDVLDEIVAWAERAENRDHPVVTVHLDLKNSYLPHAAFAVAMDGILTDRFGLGRLHRPGVVVGAWPDLVRGARAGGWPILGRLRGRFVFCLSGHSKRKTRYARHEPRSRVCFADYPGSRGAPRKGHRVFANLFVDADGYPGNLARVKRAPGFVARGYNIVHRRTWDPSIEGGANLLSGDILDSDDLSLGGEGMAVIPWAR